MRRPLVIAALAAPFLFAGPQRWLIPSWYEASVYVAGALLLIHVITAGIVVTALVRHRAWRRSGRAIGTLAIVAIAVVAAVVTWAGAMREGLFRCGRELDEVVACPGGGEAYSFTQLCIAGNPEVQVEVRPNWLPFMHHVSAESARQACNKLGM